MNFGHFWISDGVEMKPLETARSMVDELTQQLLQTEYCVVTDTGLTYTSYETWIKRNFPDYLDYFFSDHDIVDIKPDRLYRVIGHAPHKENSKVELYLIQDMDDEQVFIVEKDGIVITTTATVKNYTTTLRCDKLDTTISCDIEERERNTADLTVDFNIQKSVYENILKGGERNMDNRILDLYAERAKEKIRKEYETIVNNDYDKLDVVKEYNELVSTFNTSLAEMANRYNNEENTYLHRTGYELTPMYELSDDIKANIREKYLDEAKARLKDIDLLVEEVRAVLGVSNTEEYRIGVLKEYGIIDKKGKLNI